MHTAVHVSLSLSIYIYIYIHIYLYIYVFIYIYIHNIYIYTYIYIYICIYIYTYHHISVGGSVCSFRKGFLVVFATKKAPGGTEFARCEGGDRTSSLPSLSLSLFAKHAVISRNIVSLGIKAAVANHSWCDS